MIVTTTTIMIMIIMIITVIVVMKITTIIIIIYVGTQLIQAIFNAPPPPISYIAYYIYIYEPFFFIYLWSLSIRSSISLIYRSD